MLVGLLGLGRPADACYVLGPERHPDDLAGVYVGEVSSLAQHPELLGTMVVDVEVVTGIRGVMVPSARFEVDVISSIAMRPPPRLGERWLVGRFPDGGRVILARGPAVADRVAADWPIERAEFPQGPALPWVPAPPASGRGPSLWVRLPWAVLGLFIAAVLGVSGLAVAKNGPWARHGSRVTAGSDR